MPNQFLEQFMAGWSMGQGRNESMRRDQELQMEQARQAQMAQQQAEEFALRQQEFAVRKKALAAEEAAHKLDAANKAYEMKTQAASLQSILPTPTAQEVGIQQAVPDVGPPVSQINVPQPSMDLPNPVEGQPAIPMPILTGPQQQQMAEAERQKKMREVLGMLQLQEAVKAQYRQPERPVSVAPGGTLVNPSTGKPIYTAPKPQPEPGELSPKQTQNYMTITNKFQADPIMAASGNARQASQLADEAIKNPGSVTNQLTTLYLLVKNLDPTSAVREGELGLAQSTQSYWQKFQSSWARVSSGQIIAPAAAKELAKATKQVVKQWEDRGTARINQYKAQAKGAGVGQQFEEYLKSAGISNTGIDPEVEQRLKALGL